jgi:hypothetical protein
VLHARDEFQADLYLGFAKEGRNMAETAGACAGGGGSANVDGEMMTLLAPCDR